MCRITAYMANIDSSTKRIVTRTMHRPNVLLSRSLQLVVVMRIKASTKVQRPNKREHHQTIVTSHQCSSHKCIFSANSYPPVHCQEFRIFSWCSRVGHRSLQKPRLHKKQDGRARASWIIYPETGSDTKIDKSDERGKGRCRSNDYMLRKSWTLKVL